MTRQHPIRMQDLRTLFRARVITGQLAAEHLDSAIEAARTELVTTKGRRQYLQEILPAPVAHAVPGAHETFIVECQGGRRFHLHDGTLPLWWRICDIETQHGTQAVRVIHRNGTRHREYWL